MKLKDAISQANKALEEGVPYHTVMSDKDVAKELQATLTANAPNTIGGGLDFYVEGGYSMTDPLIISVKPAAGSSMTLKGVRLLTYPLFTLLPKRKRLPSKRAGIFHYDVGKLEFSSDASIMKLEDDVDIAISLFLAGGIKAISEKVSEGIRFLSFIEGRSVAPAISLKELKSSQKTLEKLLYMSTFGKDVSEAASLETLLMLAEGIQQMLKKNGAKPNKLLTETTAGVLPAVRTCKCYACGHMWREGKTDKKVRFCPDCGTVVTAD